ncbi:MAG: hypothetical protein KIT31_16520 [Deltaproteobacteria bacterium]|nr:hypothetical protein [Deltaproteobacteria bacterium]
MPGEPSWRSRRSRGRPAPRPAAASGARRGDRRSPAHRVGERELAGERRRAERGQRRQVRPEPVEPLRDQLAGVGPRHRELDGEPLQHLRRDRRRLPRAVQARHQRELALELVDEPDRLADGAIGERERDRGIARHPVHGLVDLHVVVELAQLREHAVGGRHRRRERAARGAARRDRDRREAVVRHARELRTLALDAEARRLDVDQRAVRPEPGQRVARAVPELERPRPAQEDPRGVVGEPRVARRDLQLRVPAVGIARAEPQLREHQRRPRAVLRRVADLREHLRAARAPRAREVRTAVVAEGVAHLGVDGRPVRGRGIVAGEHAGPDVGEQVERHGDPLDRRLAPRVLIVVRDALEHRERGDRELHQEQRLAEEELGPLHVRGVVAGLAVDDPLQLDRRRQVVLLVVQPDPALERPRRLRRRDTHAGHTEDHRGDDRHAHRASMTQGASSIATSTSSPVTAVARPAPSRAGCPPRAGTSARIACSPGEACTVTCPLGSVTAAGAATIHAVSGSLSSVARR